MKILMVTANYDDRILALLEFKKLNIAHSIDFVSNGYELSKYLNSKVICPSELPNLLLINSNIQSQDGIDPLLRIISNLKRKNVQVVVFSTFSNLSNILTQKEGVAPQSSRSNADELIWILREICGGLATRAGWRYQLKSNSLNAGVIA